MLGVRVHFPFNIQIVLLNIFFILLLNANYRVDNPTSPLSALFSPPTSPAVTSVNTASQIQRSEAKGMVSVNVQLCAGIMVPPCFSVVPPYCYTSLMIVDILTEILTTPRTKAFVLMARYTHSDLWYSERRESGEEA